MIGKMILREIKSSFGRFIAIFAIVALGVGFFTGLRVSRTAMIKTLNQYTTDTNMFDWRMVSTLGFDEDDIQAVSQLDFVENAEGCFYLDLNCDTPVSSGLAVRCFTMPQNVNQLFVKEGRLPQSADECVVDAWFLREMELGSTLSLSADNDAEDLDAAACKTFTVVGKVNTPLYINYERGISQLGGGKTIDCYAFFLDEAFEHDYYTDIYLTIIGTTGGVYTDAYNAQVTAYEDELNAFLEQRAEIRFDRFYGEAEDQINEAQSQYDEGKAQYEEGAQQLSDSFEQLNLGEEDYLAGLDKISESREQYEEGVKKYQSGLADYNKGKAQLDSAKDQYNAGLAKYNDGLAKYNDGLAQYNDGLAKYNDGLAQLESSEKQLDSLLSSLNMTRSAFSVSAADEKLEELRLQLASGIADLEYYAGQLDTSFSRQKSLELKKEAKAYQQQLDQLNSVSGQSIADSIAAIDSGKAELNDAKAQLDASKPALDDAKAQLDSSKKQLDDGKAVLDANEAKLVSAKRQLDSAKAQLDDAREQLAQGEIDLADAREQLDDGWVSYEDGQQELIDAKTELDDASSQLTEAREKLKDFQPADTYLLGRNTNTGYVCFENDSNIVRSISKVFPVFFFAVAALICITTMTRMVSEQRTQIGVLKALGYGKRAIMNKYLAYTGIASVLGSIFGCIVGSLTMPRMIWQAYNIMYGFASLSYAFDWTLAIVSSLCFIACTVLATWYACFRELHSVPAELIRPAAPKGGKHILLEKLPFIWNRVPFLHKVSIRNVLRYRQRMLMMVLGIGGCTALLLTGFGINDSIKGVVEYQYGEVVVMDCDVTFSGSLPQTARDMFMEEYGSEIDSAKFYSSKTMDTSNGEITKEASVFTVENNDSTGFINLQMDGKTVPIPDNGIVINDGLADRLGLTVGDSLTLSYDNGAVSAQVTVGGIFENHVYNYIFMTPETYESCFGEEPLYTGAWLNVPEGTDPHSVAGEILGRDEVLNVEILADMVDRFSKMLDSMEYITLVIIVSAGSLAFIVLYNLSNINITERIREIATIKVLGFYSPETFSYVFRENFVLTLAGAVVGIPMGLALHRFVIEQIKVELISFDVRVLTPSYIWAVALTIVFFCVISFAMKGKLNRIDMAQALKSVE